MWTGHFFFGEFINHVPFIALLANHMAVDAERWVEASISLPLLFSIPYVARMSCFRIQDVEWSLIMAIFFSCVRRDLIEYIVFSLVIEKTRLELALSIYLLYRLLGWSMFVGLLVFAILIPLQAKSANFMNSFQEEHLKWMDERLRLMSEILSNIKIVKLYNW